MNDQSDPSSATTPLDTNEALCALVRDGGPLAVLDEAAWLALLIEIDREAGGP